MRPPGKDSPLVIFSRPSYDWVNRINLKAERVAQLKQSSGAFEEISRSLEFDCAQSAMSLASGQLSGKIHDQTEMDFDPVQAIRTVAEAAREGRSAALTPELLLVIRHGEQNSAGFRSSDPQPREGARPIPAVRLVAALTGAFQWFTADSFMELNPVEQSSICFLRLIEIQPFESRNEETAIIASSLFTLRSGLPPLIVPAERVEQYRSAKAAGLAMNTTAMVDLFAHSIEHSLDQIIQVLERQSPP